tara:strand:+ start:112 stop:981 length:870 start_codon:yes stop_codon:yes gene_type:complete
MKNKYLSNLLNSREYEGIYDVMDNELYHSTKHQSATNLRDFMGWCGEGAMENKTNSKKQTKEMLEGDLIHHKIEFKEHESKFAVAPDVDRRTTDGKAKFAEFEAGLGHRKAITEAQLIMANDCMDRVWSDSDARLFLENGKMERSGFCEIMGVPVKARPDIDCSHVPHSENFPCLVDIKTRKNGFAHEDKWLKDFFKEKVYLQVGLQILVWRQIGYQVEEYVHILVERGNPHCVNVIKLPKSWINASILQTHYAIEKWKSWLESGSPKSYGAGIKTLAFPDWMEMKLAI